MSKPNSQTTPTSKNILDHKPTILFIILAAFFICNAIVAEFIGVKIFAVEPTEASIRLIGIFLGIQVLCLFQQAFYYGLSCLS